VAEVTKIAWTDSTFNPWKICTPVGTGCLNCYAAALSRRYGWGEYKQGVPRQRTTETYWKQPLAWNKKAAASGKPWRVFCASLGDVFDNEVPDRWRMDLFSLIAATPNLSWLLVTKRIGNVAAMCQRDGLMFDMLPHVRILITVVNQEEADRDIPRLLALPCKNGISYEPALGPVDWSPWLHKSFQRTQGLAARTLFDNEIGDYRAEKDDAISHPENLPPTHRLPSIFSDPSVVPTHNTAGNLSSNPVQDGGIGVVDSQPHSSGQFSPVMVVDVPLTIEHPGDVRENCGVSRNANTRGVKIGADATQLDIPGNQSPSERCFAHSGLPRKSGNGVAGKILPDQCGFLHNTHCATSGIEWVIVGGESSQPGHPARPFNVQWARSTIEQCKTDGVPVFVKQLGSFVYGDANDLRNPGLEGDTSLIGDGRGGALAHWKLKNRAGADPAEWPEDLRVREFPA